VAVQTLTLVAGGRFTGPLDLQAQHRHRIIQQLNAAGASFHRTQAGAKGHAESRGWALAFLPGIERPRRGFEKAGETEPLYVSVDPAKLSGGTGGGAAAGSPGGGSASALAAVQANQPMFTGGAESVEPETVDNNVRLTERGVRFEGLDTFTPDEKLPSNKSPHLINWNSIERAGSYCARRGTGRVIDDITTCKDSGNADITATHKGLSIVPIPLNDPSDLNAQHTTALLLAFTATEPGVAGAVNVCGVEPFVAYGAPESLRGYPGPALVLSNPVAGTLRVAANYVSSGARFNARSGLAKGFVKGISIAYSLQRYPRDVDKRDERDGKTVVLVQDRASWDGSATNFDITGLTVAGRYFVSVWAHSLEGTSEPSLASFEVTVP
jgi:hypothetical protein